ncbi:hypothetical protein [Stakelama marina]|uniref:Uncharacterized protein n=1 Tax=Stakelama marina TaxID=2826939 RepID=A0A8T4IMZ2_9SPHN|nr:hypothetical protein [Stakelama marina]MBR0553699.1 hypothetical protein [Stakelama marina]
MRVLRIFAALCAMALGFAATPASAQFFLKPVDLSGPRVTGAEPGMVGQAFPGATPEELNAALVWNLRAALNVAALQCQFAPSLLTVENYNALLENHSDELENAYKTLAHYFDRTAGSKRAGQAKLDQYSTRVYSGFSTVGGQLSFCQTANDIGLQAEFAPRGGLKDLAERRMHELRRSLLSWGEQRFRDRFGWEVPRLIYFANDECWKDGEYYTKRCGPYPAAG